MRRPLLLALLAALFGAPALADRGPPEGSQPLSRIVAEVEKRSDVAYIEEIEYDDGVYEIEYRTKDGRERKLRIDPRTGAERDR